MTTDLRISQLSDLATSQLVEVYDSVLRPAFRSEELMTRESFVGEFASAGDGAPSHVLLEGITPVGVLLTEWYVDRQVLLLAYLAVVPRTRGQGLGTMLTDHLQMQLRQMPVEPIALAEVDDPRAWPGDEATGDAEARLRFYARRGARLVPVHYFQPRLRPGTGAGRVHGMLLIRLDQRSTVASGLLRQFLTDYFTACEGAGSLTDPEVVRLLHEVSALDDNAPLPPLSEWPRSPSTLKGEPCM